MSELMPAITGVYIPLIPVRLLNPASHAYWYATREARFNMPLDQLAREKGGQKAWDDAKPFLDKMTALLKENESGPYFLGDEVSYADFVWGGFLLFIQRIGVDVWEDLLRTAGEGGEVHGKLLLGLDRWSARSDR